MGSGHEVPKPDTSGHPNRQVGRSRYTDKYGNPTDSPLQAWGRTPSAGGLSGPADSQVDAFERNSAAQAIDDRSRDADMDWRDRYREDD